MVSYLGKRSRSIDNKCALLIKKYAIKADNRQCFTSSKQPIQQALNNIQHSRGAHVQLFIANNIQNMSSVTLYSIIINIISTEMTTTTIHDKGSTKCSEGKNIHNLKSALKRRLKRCALCKEGYHWSGGISRDYRERL